MKNIALLVILLTLFTACQSGQKANQSTAKSGVHMAMVKDVLQTNQYTYLNVMENGKEAWLALPKMQATAGETYYYKDGLVMKNFVSKELNRTFDEILFLDNISSSPEITEKTETSAMQAEANVSSGGMSETAPATSEEAAPSTMHTVVVKEVLQTNQYTYLRATEAGQEIWLAVTKMDASVGDTYYFQGGLKMTAFASKELKRTFDEILFVDNLSKHPGATTAAAEVNTQNKQSVSTGSSVQPEKKGVNVKHDKDDITIASLYENKAKYAGKSIKVKGQVTKFNSGIMKKNWIHLQDGTEYSGKFDFVVTTDQEVKVGDKVTVEGTITLDKDFGFGYYYEVLMEDAKLSK